MRRGRRILVTAAAYVLAISVVLGAARALADVLLLPPLFLTLLAGMAVLGLPLAILLAWRYDRPFDR